MVAAEHDGGGEGERRGTAKHSSKPTRESCVSSIWRNSFHLFGYGVRLACAGSFIRKNSAIFSCAVEAQLREGDSAAFDQLSEGSYVVR